MLSGLVRPIIVGFLLGIFFLMGVGLANAEGTKAQASYLGMCHRLWPCSQSLKVFDGLPVKRVGWLAETFGRTCACPKRFLKLPGSKEVRVHLANGTCFPERGRRCAEGEPFHGETVWSADWKLGRRNAGLLRKYRTSLRRTERILQVAGADTTVLLSLCLECPLSHRARRSLLAEAEAVFPNGRFVDSVLTQRCLKGLICEKHGSAPRVTPPCIIDTDGIDFRTIDLPGFLKAGQGCEAAGLWVPPFNLVDVRLRSFQFPLERTTPPTRADFRALRRWLRR